MGRKGWAGSPPRDDDDARKRIIDAALRCIERRGPAQTSLADVADELSITRRTVYRYFATTEELFTAAAEIAMDGFVTRIEKLTADIDDVAGQLVEVVAFIVERLPDEPLLTLLLENDRTNQFSRRMLSPSVIERCRIILRHSRIHWDDLGYRSDADLDELIEFLLRIIQSMVIAPHEPPRNGAALRAFLHRWVGPALTAPR
ncbi:TetR/AcrR family transcriptional regulator [Mycobacterium sp. NAZ190054]|uniref:TetR/AcrR family transcriptional regulator n=1 Tax=Mycobacterium sp. NAZ190054 TaxID=1747766 RepID=UPI00079CA19A|nr:TetR/AcrR family transcriptional regulator [Mycobacterium sp. NAZ190054]KWX68463.1 TetR family transcriptional regulator [Mycobacterium sp. NAZ190054]